MTLQPKQLSLDTERHIQLLEQVVFSTGEEGLRVWESGIVMSRYILRNVDEFKGKVVVELGSGTGIAGLTLLKYSEAAHVHFTDYTEQIAEVLQKNIAMQTIKTSKVNVGLVDWTKPETWESLLGLEKIDRVMATDVVYDGSPYGDLAKLLHAIKKRHPQCEINVMLPLERKKGQDFKDKMESQGFKHTVETLSDEYYRQPALPKAKESEKYYPGLSALTFHLYKF